MSIPRKSLDTSNGRKKTNKLSWCSFFKSLNPCIFARCDNAFYFSNEYTMAALLRYPRPKAVISPAIHFSTPSLLLKFPLPSTQMWPIVSSQGTKIGETGSFHIAWRPVFSDNCAVSPEGGHLLTLSMWVSHYLLRVIGLDSATFDFSAQVLLVPGSTSGAGRWFHRLSRDLGRYLIRVLVAWPLFLFCLINSPLTAPPPPEPHMVDELQITECWHVSQLSTVLQVM